MSKKSDYIDMDINKLFKDLSIKDIELMQKKIQVESDWKKVELRTLVGERYRDFIKAADTIAEMKVTSSSVIQRITDTERRFQDLEQKYSIGFKVNLPEKVVDKAKHRVSDAVVVQMKILIDIPEHIWSAIDDKNLLRASQLFILAQHINYSVTFEVGQSILMQKYPLVSKQWCIINNFRNIITEESKQILQSVELSADTAANCLCSLVLMEKTTSKNLLERLIQFRSKAVESIIKEKNPLSVRHRIKLSVKLLTDTIALIHSCFINTTNHQNGLIAFYMKTITDQDASKMLSQLDLNNQLIHKYLPSVTKNHKPFAKDEFIEISISDIREELKSWFTWIQNFTKFEISRLLNLVTSVKGIFNIREEAISVRLPENWNNIWIDLSMTQINFWTQYIHPLLTNRVKEIVKIRWDDSLADLKSHTINLLVKLSNEKFDYPEHDLKWFIWKDSPTDIPQKLSKNTGNINMKRSLLMKARGYSPNLVDLCANIDTSLYALLLDLEQYLYGSEKVSSMTMTEELLSTNLLFVFDKFSDRLIIQKELQRISAVMIENLIQFIKDECINEFPNYGKRDINRIFLARFLQAFLSLSLNLNKCFTLSKISGLTMTNLKWQNVCDKVRQESIVIWSIFAENYRKNIQEYLNKYLTYKSIDGLSVDTTISEWEKVTIEEEAEEGKRINSKILVPYRPSASLEVFLAEITKELNKTIPHTIPKKVFHEIIENIVQELFNYYEKIAKSENLRQKQAFQSLLDIKYVTLLMVQRENKLLIDKSQQIVNSLVAKIDPFDSDVFYPFIHANVKKSVQRSLLIFGNLVPQMEQLYSVLGARSELDNAGKLVTDPPGVLAVCNGAPWFPPLAVTLPAQNLSLIPIPILDKMQQKKTPVKEHKRNDSTGATIKSGAAAFFGTDWFRS